MSFKETDRKRRASIAHSSAGQDGKGRKDATEEGVWCVVCGRKRSDDLPSLTPPRKCEEGYSTTKGHELVARAR